MTFSCLLWTGSSRRISCFLNPGLNSTSDVNTNIVHIVAEGENDVIHYVWSTYKLPSVIVARTTVNTTLSINSTKLISFEKDAIVFKNGKPLESVGLTFDKLWELKYPKDTSEINEASSVDDLDLESLLWSDVNETLKCSDTFASAVLKGTANDLLFSKNGTFEIQFSISAEQEISGEYPHLVFTGNSTLLKLVFHNFYSNNSRTRYGLGLSIFSVLSDNCDKDIWDIVKSKSINDEYSPGVFTDVELLAPCSIEDKESSFVAWRPVAYTGPKPIVANSSDVTIMMDPKVFPDVSIISIAELYFAEKSNMSVFNLTFGTQGDGFYVATQYTAWSLMLGTGQMVEIPISLSVIIFASVGVGLVLLFTVCGAVYIVYKRCKERDDDLLLN